MAAMGPSFCGRRKSGAFLSNEKCVWTFASSKLNPHDFIGGFERLGDSLR
jgi:hypothetical protein